MLKDDLKEYTSLLREAEQCELELKILKRKKTEDKRLARRIRPLEQKCLRLKKASLQKAENVEKFITSCPDSYLRQILFLRYIKDYSWEKVAYKAGGRNKGDTVRKMAERYIEKIEKRNI